MISAEHQVTNKGAFVRIFLTALLAHGMLPMSTMVVSDDWFTLFAFRERLVGTVWHGAVFLSMPLTILQALPFFLVGDNLFLLRGFNFLVIVGLGQMLFLVLTRLRTSGHRDALWVALFAVAFPGYLVHFMVSFLCYPLGLLLFLVGLWLVLRAEIEEVSRRRRWLLGLAALLVFYSFHFGALLVFYMLFVGAHFYDRWRRSGLDVFRAGCDYVVDRYLFLLLPFWFWGLRQAVSLAFPTWEQYNQPRLDWAMIRTGLGGFLSSYRLIAGEIFVSPWFGGTILVGLLWVLLSRRTGPLSRVNRQDILWAGLGLTILLAGILPFVLVGKYPQLGPVPAERLGAFDSAAQHILIIIDSRMHLFLGIGAGFLLLHAGRMLTAKIGLRESWLQVILMAVLVSCVVKDIQFYLRLEKSAIVMAGVREHMRSKPELKEAAVIGVVDGVGNVGVTWDSWVLFLETVWGDRAHHGVPELWYGRDQNARLLYDPTTIVNHRLYGGVWHPYFKTPESAAPQATVVILPGDRYFEESDLGASFLYQFYRVFAPKRLPGFVRKFARIAVLPKVNPAAALQQPAFVSHWQELEPRKGMSSVPGRQSFAGPDVSFPLRPMEERSFVLFEVLPSGDEREDDRMIIADSGGAVLPTFRTRRTDGVTVLLAPVESSSREVRVTARQVEAGVSPDWLVLRARQQPEADTAPFWMLAEPFLRPDHRYPEAFHGRWEADDVLFPWLLRGPDETPAYGRFERKGGRLAFHPAEAGDYVRTRMLSLQPGLQCYVRIDWMSRVAGQSFVTARLVDDAGQPVMELAAPPEGGMRKYMLPHALTPASVRIQFSSAANGSRAIMPAQVELLQGAPLLQLRVPVAELFESAPILSLAPPQL